jgi:surfactin synthase thioesterase subunit/acyl carrier protein
MPRKFFMMILEAGDTTKPKAKTHLPAPSKAAAQAHNSKAAAPKPALAKATPPTPAVTQPKPAPPVVQAAPKPAPPVIQVAPKLVAPVTPVAPAPAPKAPAKPKEDKVTPALQIVSEESGIAMEDLTDDCAFADIGVDSLLSMVIASRFREELGLDLDLEFSIFMDLPTVKHMRDFLDPPSDLAEPVVGESKAAAPAPVEVPQPAPVAPTPAPAPIVSAPKVSSKPNEKKEDRVTPALMIVSEESGIAIEDLTDDCAFADIGVDSLLSMVIASRFREELGLDLDLEFSIFMDLPTVKHMRDFLDPPEDSESTEAEEVAPSAYEEAPVSAPQVEVIVTLPAEEVVKVSEPVADTNEVSAASTELIENALQIVSEESGIAVEDLTDDCLFSEIGVDSLLSMVIASRFREELGLDLDLEFSIFLDLPTVKHMKQYFASGGKDKEGTAQENGSSSDEWDTSNISTPNKVPSDAGVESLSSGCSSPPSEEIKPREPSYCRPATSVILQGFPKSAKMTLFLLPDGGGSSSSYVPLPRLNADCALVGLNCPYARDAWNLKCHHDDLINAYMNEIRRRQPSGPYHLGGWSSGGIMAYMVAYKLIKAGEVVTNLIVIDSPVPKIMDRLPTKFHEFCDSIGLFGNAMGAATPTAPEWLIPHFNATVEVLADYRAVPLPRGCQMPKMSIIWACEAVLDESVVPPEELVNSKGIHFLLEKRSDFSPCGWEELLPGTEFVLDRVEGGNHFTMMVRLLVFSSFTFELSALFFGLLANLLPFL